MNVATQVQADEKPKLFELTLDDFSTLHDAGAFEGRRKVELIEGVLYEVAPQRNRHARLKTRLAFELQLALRHLGSRLEVLVECTVAMPKKSAPEPDIAIVSDQIGEGYVAVAAVALLIEVSSTTYRFDTGEKAALYARNAVAEYWVVDLERDRVLRFTGPTDEGFRQQDEVALGSVIASHTIAGLAVDTAGLA